MVGEKSDLGPFSRKPMLKKLYDKYYFIMHSRDCDRVPKLVNFDILWNRGILTIRRQELTTPGP